MTSQTVSYSTPGVFSSLNASGNMKMTQVWDRLEKLFGEKHEFGQPRTNFHKDIKCKVICISNVYKKVKEKKELFWRSKALP